MRTSPLTVGGLVTIVLAGVLSFGIQLSGQSTSPQSGNPPAATAVKRLAWGAPDLQGIWSTATVTPLERPAGAAEFLSDAEVAEIERKAVIAATDEARGADRAADVTGAYNDFWWDRGTKANRRTSLVFDPPNGRLPALAPAAKAYAESPEAQRVQDTRRGMYPAASWTDTDLWDRCLTRGLPMMPGPYNNNFQIFQTEKYLVILHEMIHDARIIPIGVPGEFAAAIPQWFGSSTARWEGDTLVATTKHFANKQELPFSPRMTAEGMELTERFTRLDDGTLNYQFTVNHPSIYSAPWSVELPMRKGDGAVYEYACHEGNYGIVGILTGSREMEKTGQKKRPETN